MVELSYQPNFNISFSNTKADVLIHLSQWQYWWWFWFNLVWVLYFFILIRVLRFRSLKFHPKIASSTRPHGKWGDLIICILPLCWCTNILINSNFLLKMVEWQNESNLFTLRVRGKQWYWVYKIDVKGLLESISAKKNIGHDNWTTSIEKDSDDYSQNINLLQSKLSSEWYKDYIKDINTKDIKKNKQNFISLIDYSTNYELNQVKPELFNTNLNNYFFNITLNHKFKSLFECYNIFFNKIKLKNIINNEFNFKIYNALTNDNKINSLNINKSLLLDVDKVTKSTKNTLDMFEINDFYSFKYNDLIENSRFIHRPSNKRNILRIINKPMFIDIDSDISNINSHRENSFVKHFFKEIKKTLLIYDFDDKNLQKFSLKNLFYPKDYINYILDWYFYEIINVKYNKEINSMFKLRFSENLKSIFPKDSSDNLYYTLKQKRYSRKREVSNLFFNKDRSLNTKEEFFNKPVFRSIKKLEDTTMSYTRQYRMFKKSKKKNSDIPVTLTKRLLRTNKILVLPAHVNITAVANSYDVVHSWFIPGLGLKIDCIPGRSTHHTFFIDNVGFYYGQCAEVCGRYHHHMPIKLCALPLNHFFLWWHASALPKILFSNKSKDLALHYSSKKFSW